MYNVYSSVSTTWGWSELSSEFLRAVHWVTVHTHSEPTWKQSQRIWYYTKENCDMNIVSAMSLPYNCLDVQSILLPVQTLSSNHSLGKFCITQRGLRLEWLECVLALHLHRFHYNQHNIFDIMYVNTKSSLSLVLLNWTITCAQWETTCNFMIFSK